MKLTTRRSMLATLAASACGTVLPSMAQTYPSRRISVVVPFPAGGPADVVARVMQPLVQQALGEIVIVENYGGVGGALGVGKALAAPADGHTILIGTVAEPILPPLVMPSVRYEPAELRLVTPLSYTDIALVVRPGLGLKSLDDFLRRARDGGQAPLSYATPGSGTLFHLMTEHFKALSGARLLHVPYKGLAPAVNDLLGAQVDMAFLPMAGNTAKLIGSGKLQALATCAAPGAKSELPRIADQKELQEFAYTVWTGVFVGRATPEPVVQRLHQALDQALQGPSFGEYTREAGGVARTRALPSEESDRFFASETQRLTRIFHSVKLEVD